jgi:hypothetical protein
MPLSMLSWRDQLYMIWIYARGLVTQVMSLSVTRNRAELFGIEFTVSHLSFATTVTDASVTFRRFRTLPNPTWRCESTINDFVFHSLSLAQEFCRFVFLPHRTKILGLPKWRGRL